MIGRLPRSRSPPQPKTRMMPARRERTQGAKRPLQRIGRVRVVAQHRARPVADEFHPSRHLRCRGEPRRDLGHRVPQRERARGSGQRIRHVEVAQQRQHHLGAAEAPVEQEPAADGAELQVRGADVGVGTQAEGDAPVAPRQRHPRGVVDVHHRDTGQAEQRRQLQLGGEVRLHRAVIVEMIAREVGEDARREGEAVEPALVEAVRRCLHRDGSASAIAQRGERRLKVDRVRAW